MCDLIGILIPTTSHKRNWNNFEETSFYNIYLNSFLKTYSPSYSYVFYLIVDDDDPIFAKPITQEHIIQYVKQYENLSLKFLSTSDIPKGWVTKMWNRAFEEAYKDGCQYFFQCGDDICFETNGWVHESIQQLKQHNNIGLTGPIDDGRFVNNNPIFMPGGQRFIHTQAFVSRKHMEIFGTFFPEQIKNWFCDDWITHVYYPQHFYILKCYLKNKGGEPRYDIETNCPWEQLISKGKIQLQNYLQYKRNEINKINSQKASQVVKNTFQNFNKYL